VINWWSIDLIGLPWLLMFSKLEKDLTKRLWASLNLYQTSGLC
jgi:hypothetical protein